MGFFGTWQKYDMKMISSWTKTEWPTTVKVGTSKLIVSPLTDTYSVLGYLFYLPNGYDRRVSGKACQREEGHSGTDRAP